MAYHPRLAYFMCGQFPAAAKTYHACLDRTAPGSALPDGWRGYAAHDNESRVRLSDWLYRSLRRAGRTDDANALPRGISEGPAVRDDEPYYRALLFCQAVRTEPQVLPDEAF